MVVVCSQLSHLTFGDKDGTLIFSTLIWLVALTPFEVDLSLTTRLTRGGCILRLDQGLSIIRYYLTWSHWPQGTCFA